MEPPSVPSRRRPCTRATRVLLLLLLAFMTLPAWRAAAAATLAPVHTFAAPSTAGGVNPDGSLPRDLALGGDAALYGTTFGGGDFGKGTIFKLSGPSFATFDTVTPLHSFTGDDGAVPNGPLLKVANGDFYGTTGQGGGAGSMGTIFKLAANGDFTVLYRFASGNPPEGNSPANGALLQGDDVVQGGVTYLSFYGSASTGGTGGSGTIYRVLTDGTAAGTTVNLVYAFSSGFTNGDGAFPNGGLVSDGPGILYGTTGAGGLNSQGVIFKIATDGTAANTMATTVYTCPASGGVIAPNGALVGAGNTQTGDGRHIFYGTSAGGGTGSGTVFRLTTDGSFNTGPTHNLMEVLHAFGSVPNDGSHPRASVVVGSDHKYYGTTSHTAGDAGSGTVYRVATDGTFELLYTFSATTINQSNHDVNAEGAFPGGLLEVFTGVFYGSASGGQNGTGTIFRFNRDGDPTIETPTFTVNGSTTPSTVAPQAIVNFVANLTTTAPSPRVRVQSSTDNLSWTNLSDGNDGLMTSSGGTFSLSTASYPSGPNVYFRVQAEAEGYTPSTSTAIGPFNLQGSVVAALTIDLRSELYDPHGTPTPATEVRAGDTILYTLTVTNNSNALANKLAIVDQLPLYTGLDDLHHQVVPSVFGKGKLVNELDDQGKVIKDASKKPVRDLKWLIGDLAVGHSASVSFRVKVTTQYRLVSTVSNTLYSVVSTANPPVPAIGADGDAAPHISIPVMPVASFTGLVDSVTQGPGGMLTYTLHVENLSTLMLTNVKVNFAIPNDTNFVSSLGNPGAVATNEKETEFKNHVTDLVWTIPQLKPGAFATLAVVVQAKADLPTQSPTTLLSPIAFVDFPLSGTKVHLANFDDNAGTPPNVTISGAAAVAPPRLFLGKQVVDDPKIKTDNVAFETDANGNQVPSVPTAKGAPGGKSEITFLVSFKNTAAAGSGTATGCFLKDRIPDHTKYTANSAFVQMNTDKSAHDSAFLESDGETIVFPLPDLAPGDAGFVIYRVTLDKTLLDGAIVQSVGADIGAANLDHTEISQPAEVDVTVRGTPAVSVEVHQDTTALLHDDQGLPSVGFKRYTIFYQNTGTGPAVGTTIRDLIPTDTVFLNAAFLTTGANGEPGVSRDPEPGEHLYKPSPEHPTRLTFYVGKLPKGTNPKSKSLGTLAPGESGWLKLEVLESADAVQAPKDPLVNEASIGLTKPAVAPASDAVALSAPIGERRPLDTQVDPFLVTGTSHAETQKIDPSIANPYIYVEAPRAVPESGEITYTIVVGNDSAATMVGPFLQMGFPKHTSFVSATAGVGVIRSDIFPDSPSFPPIQVLFNLSDLPPHGFASATVVLKAEPGFEGDSVVVGKVVGKNPDDGSALIDGYLSLTCVNAKNFDTPPIPTYVYGAAGKSAAEAFDQARDKIALTAYTNAGIEAANALASPTFATRVSELATDSVSHTVVGADCFALANGSLIIPMGNNQALVAGIVGQGGGNIVGQGGLNIVAQGGLNIVGQGGGNLVAVGDTSAIKIDGLGGTLGLLSVGEILTQTAAIVGQGGGNIVGQGGGNLISQDGSHIVDNSIASIISEHGAGFEGQAAGDLNGLHALAPSLATAGFNLQRATIDPSIVMSDSGDILAFNTSGYAVMVRGAAAGQQLVNTNGSNISSSLNGGALQVQGHGTLVNTNGSNLVNTNGSNFTGAH